MEGEIIYVLLCWHDGNIELVLSIDPQMVVLVGPTNQDEDLL